MADACDITAVDEAAWNEAVARELVLRRLAGQERLSNDETQGQSSDRARKSTRGARFSGLSSDEKCERHLRVLAPSNLSPIMEDYRTGQPGDGRGGFSASRWPKAPRRGTVRHARAPRFVRHPRPLGRLGGAVPGLGARPP